MSDVTGEITATSAQLTERISAAVVKGILPMIVLIVATVVQAIRHGTRQHYVLLGVAAAFSIVALFSYGLLVKLKLEGAVRRGWVPMLVTFSAFIPYLFGCYLCFIEGFWRLKTLLQGFSWSVLLVSGLFIVGGYWLVVATHQVSEFGKFERVPAHGATAV